MEVKQNIQLCAREMSKQTHGLRTKVKVDIYARFQISLVWKHSVSLDAMVAKAEELMLYLETDSAGVDYDVDNVVMKRRLTSDAWRKQAEEDIERIRKRNITINFSGIDTSDLVLDVTQVGGDCSENL